MLLKGKLCAYGWTALSERQLGRMEQVGWSYTLQTPCKLKLHYFYLSLLGCSLVILSLLSAYDVCQVAAMQTRWGGESSVQFPYFYVSASHSLVFQCPPIAWHVLEEEGEAEMHSLSGNVYKHCARRATADMVALHTLWESRLIVRPAMIWGVMLDRHWARFQRWRTVNMLHLPKTPCDTLLTHPLLSTGSISKCFITILAQKLLWK